MVTGLVRDNDGIRDTIRAGTPYVRFGEAGTVLPDSDGNKNCYIVYIKNGLAYIAPVLCVDMRLDGNLSGRNRFVCRGGCNGN